MGAIYVYRDGIPLEKYLPEFSEKLRDNQREFGWGDYLRGYDADKKSLISAFKRAVASIEANGGDPRDKFAVDVKLATEVSEDRREVCHYLTFQQLSTLHCQMVEEAVQSRFYDENTVHGLRGDMSEERVAKAMLKAGIPCFRVPKFITTFNNELQKRGLRIDQSKSNPIKVKIGK